MLVHARGVQGVPTQHESRALRLWSGSTPRRRIEGSAHGRYTMETFGDTFLPPGVEHMRGPARHCPVCVWTYLRETPSEVDTWHCESCGRRFRLEHGRLRLIEPVAVAA